MFNILYNKKLNKSPDELWTVVIQLTKHLKGGSSASWLWHLWFKWKVRVVHLHAYLATSRTQSRLPNHLYKCFLFPSVNTTPDEIKMNLPCQWNIPCQRSKCWIECDSSANIWLIHNFSSVTPPHKESSSHTMLYSKATQYLREMWRWLTWVLWLLKGWRAEWGGTALWKAVSRYQVGCCLPGFPHSQLLRVLITKGFTAGEFPGGAAVRTQRFYWGSLGSVSGWGTKVLQVVWYGQINKLKINN